MDEVLIVIFPKGKPEDVCEELRKEYLNSLAKGISRFKFMLITDLPVRDWIDYVKCVLETNISATIRVDQVEPDSDEARELLKRSDIIKIPKE